MCQVSAKYICAMVKSRYIGDGHPTFNRNPYNGYINPYYWVDDHPLLYGNNGSLDPGNTDYQYLRSASRCPPIFRRGWSSPRPPQQDDLFVDMGCLFTNQKRQGPNAVLMENKQPNLENKLLLISINFTPKTSHSCLKKWHTRFSRNKHFVKFGVGKF